MSALLDRLRGGLIASCQPVDGGPLDRPDIVAAMARAAVQGGAAGLRIEGIENLRAARAATDVPIIGIVKTDHADSPVRITTSTEEARALATAGADIVAYDATSRPRLHDRDEVLRAILDAGVLAMADCASLNDGRHALAGGAVILGTTLSGYTEDTAKGDDAPDFGLIRHFRQLGGFVMAEGRFNTPGLAAAAIRAGADGVTVGSALTRLEVVTRQFAHAIQTAGRESRLTGFAADLGGTKTAVARIVEGRVEEHMQRPTRGEADPASHVDQIAKMLRSLGYQKGDRLGVAVTGRIGQQGNWYAVNRNTLTRIDAYPLGPTINAAIGPGSVINDAAAATLAEHRLGSGRGHENFAYITVSTGVGGGLILNGRLHQSANGLAGHIGFASTTAGELPCGSDRIGTVESVAGGWAIALAAEKAGHGATDAREIFAMAEKGTEWAETLIDASAHAVSELAADLVSMLGVTRVAFGGSIGLADGYLARVRSHQAALPRLFRADLTDAKCGVRGPLIGALLFANEHT